MAAPLMLNRPGAAVPTGTAAILLLPPLTTTATLTVPVVGVAQGTWKLICPGETKYRGAATPFTCTLTRLVVLVGHGRPSSATKVEGPTPLPYMLASAPGEMRAVPLAAFDTPPIAGKVGVSTRIA